MVGRIKNYTREVRIAIVGKYVELHDAYLSICESLRHAGFHQEAKVNIKWVNSEHLNAANIEAELGDVSGILVPGGFGDRGIEGKILAVALCPPPSSAVFRHLPGMQLAVVEFGPSALGMAGANSWEFDKGTPYPVIDLLPEQKEVEDMGGTMRLGLYPCCLKEGSKAAQLYQESPIYERHRHRYEFNNTFRDAFAGSEMDIVGVSLDDRLVEVIELSSHPWFIGCQFHPEFKSRPNRPHPLFKGFVAAALLEQERRAAD